MKLKELADVLHEAVERLGDAEVTIGYRNSRGKWSAVESIDLVHDAIAKEYTLYPNVEGSPSQGW